MAKLRANGTEDARFVREESADLRSDILRRKTELSFRSNGRVLRRTVVWFKDRYRDNGERRVDYGWKQWTTVDHLTPSVKGQDEWAASHGFRRVK